MTSTTYQLKNAMRVYAAELTCSMGVQHFSLDPTLLGPRDQRKQPLDEN